jgi:hypothetical protein
MPKIYLDEYSSHHVSARIREHFGNPAHQKIMVAKVKKLLTLWAPAEAVGEYIWHINVERIGRIILRGHSIRTVYPLTHNFPGGTEYKIVADSLVRASS